MIQRRGRSPARIIGLALIALIALPATAFANTSGPIAQTGGMSATIPLLGASLTIDVVLDPVGNLSSVGLNPVGDFSATKVGPHAVSFENTADGTTHVSIKAKGDKLSLKASAGTLAALTGPGTWTADVFGTGEMTTVAYTIGDDGTGLPTLALGAIGAPAGITVTPGTPETKTEDDGAKTSVRIDFAADGFVKKLKISVSVKFEDGDQQARLKIELSGKDKQKLSGTLADLVGPHAWAGRLCDGTEVGIAFTVVDAAGVGSVVFDPATFATGAPATATVTDNGFNARFDGTKTKVKVRLTQADDGSWSLKVSAKTDKCKDTPAADPSVNTPISPDVKKGDGHGDQQGDGDESGSGDKKGGDH